MRSTFNLLGFPNSMFKPFFLWRGYVLSGEISLKNNHYYHYYYIAHSMIVLWLELSTEIFQM